MLFSNHKIKNLVRQEATPSQQDYWKGIIRFGEGDNFPLRLARLVQNSPTATSCIGTRKDFLEGSGFSDESLADLIINGERERFGDIHAKNCDAQGLFEGFAMNVRYNIKGTVSEIYSIPFEYCRLTKPDSKGVVSKIKVNPYYGTSEYREAFTKTYDVYNPSVKTVLAQQARDTQDGKCTYKGQILYVASTGPLSRFYPAPDYYSAANWMEVDEAIGGFHKNNVNNNFFQSAIIKIIGDENAPSSHPEDQLWNETTQQYEPDPKKTNAYRFNIEMQKFTGWENSGNIMALWARIKEEAPDIQAFPSNTNSELFKTLQDITTEQIARATKVPSVLANIQSGASLGGDGNVIRASVKLMQQRVVKTHAMLERVYKELLSHLDKPYAGEVKILHYNPFPEMEKIDPLIWESLRLDERRDWVKNNTKFNLRPEQVKVNETKIDEDTLKAQAGLRGSVGGVQGVLQIQQGVVAKTTTVDSAISILTIIYGFTNDEARQLLGQPKQSIINSKFNDVFYADYPAKSKEVAQKAKNFRDSTKSNCGSKAGWQMCEDIINGRPLSYKSIKRIYNYLNKNQAFANHIFSDSCESVLFSAWGGIEMFKWASNKIASINE